MPMTWWDLADYFITIAGCAAIVYGVMHVMLLPARWAQRKQEAAPEEPDRHRTVVTHRNNKVVY